MEKILKTLALFCASALIICMCGLLIMRQYVIAQAKNKAETIIETALKTAPDQPTIDEEIIALTRYIFENFKKKDTAKIPLYKIRPYITNNRLPDFIRLPDGVMEIFINEGLCDNTARLLAFLLKEKNIKAVQWNMVTHKDAHSALLVYMPNDRKALLDPYIGFAATDPKTNKLIAPEELQARLQRGENLHNLLLPLSKESEYTFYEDFASAFMAAEGEKLEIKVTPALTKRPLLLGTINDDDTDVQYEAAQAGLTPFWHYMGHKYNREWVRMIKAPQDIRLEITLITKPEHSAITSNLKPEIKGNKLSWNLKTGDTLTFTDGNARINWQRLNSYISVDQITITPL